MAFNRGVCSFFHVLVLYKNHRPLSRGKVNWFLIDMLDEVNKGRTIKPQRLEEGEHIDRIP